MTWTASGLYVLTWIDLLDTTGLVLNLDLTSPKVAMYNNTETPNFETETVYAATNEVSGTNYTAGGKDLTGLAPATSNVSGTLKYDMGDISWASSSISNARGSKLYKTVTTNALVVAHNFGADYSTTNGTFTIQWNASGVFTIDLTPAA